LIREFHFPVKTRYGRELFNFLQQKWIPPNEWIKNNSKPHFEYILLDFSNGVFLDIDDQKLPSAIIIGLRLAYIFFVHKNIIFSENFAMKLLNIILNTLNVDFVLTGIRNHLRLLENQL